MTQLCNAHCADAFPTPVGMSPRRRLGDTACRVRQLASLKVGAGELVPPVIAYAVRWRPAELACSVAPRRVDRPHWDTVARGLYRELQVSRRMRQMTSSE